MCKDLPFICIFIYAVSSRGWSFATGKPNFGLADSGWSLGQQNHDQNRGGDLVKNNRIGSTTLTGSGNFCWVGSEFFVDQTPAGVRDKKPGSTLTVVEVTKTCLVLEPASANLGAGKHY